MITIDIDTTVFQVITDYPIIKEIMIELGFEDIVKSKMLESVGKLITMEQGCLMNEISINEVHRIFNINGFELREF